MHVRSQEVVRFLRIIRSDTEAFVELLVIHRDIAFQLPAGFGGPLREIYFAGQFLAEVAGKPLPLKLCISGLFCLAGFDVGVLCLINQLDIAQFHVQPMVDGLDMIAALRAIIGERKHHAAGLDFAPRVIFRSIAQHRFDHAADDIVTEELFEPASVLFLLVSSYHRESTRKTIARGIKLVMKQRIIAAPEP